MWVYLGIASALLLGLYEVERKHAVNGNPILPVLWGSTAFGAMLVLPVIVLSFVWPGPLQSIGLYVRPLPLDVHGMLILKTLLVSLSWILEIIALKHLPISIFAPIRASSPFWTLLGAVLIFHEQPTGLQWLGLAVILLSYYAFTLLGVREGIHFHRNKWIYSVVAGTLVGSACGLYDKYLIQHVGLRSIEMLSWFFVYMFILYSIMMVVFRLRQGSNAVKFEWRWSVPLIGISLVFSDYLYFSALQFSGALISLLIAIRRLSTVVSFLVGGLMFREMNKRLKLVALGGVLIGIFIIILS